MSKKRGIICGGIAGALAIVLVVVLCFSLFGSKKGTNDSNVLAAGADGETILSDDVAIIEDSETPLGAGPGSNDANAPTDETSEEGTLEGEEDEELEEVETSLANATVLFTGGSEESYEPTDLSWFLNAADDEVITIVYTCTISDNAGWGVLGWGATVDDVWVEGPDFSADTSNASAQMYANFTVGELKRALGITANSNVTALKLGAWNGGQIVSLSLSSAGSTPVVANAIATSLAGADGDGMIVGEETAAGLSGSYAKVFTASGQIEINIAASCPGYQMGDSVNISVTLEGDGGFSGGLGTTEGSDYHWTQNDFATDKAGTITCSLNATPTGEVAILGVWYVGGSAVGVKSISITVTQKGSSSSSGATGDFSGCSQIISAPQNIKISASSISGFEEGDTVQISATLYSPDYFNGTIGAPIVGGGWTQLGQQVCEKGGTVTWSLTVENMAYGDAELQIWWMNAKQLGIKSISATVVEKGTGAGGDGDGTGEGEGGGARPDGDVSVDGGTQGGGGTGGGSGEEVPDYAALIEKEGNVLLAETRSCGIWGQAVTWNTANWGGDFDVSLFNAQTCVVVKYSSDTAPQLVLQGTDNSWNQVNPVYVGSGYALFTYEDMIALYSELTQLGAVHIAAAGSELTVTEVKLVDITDDGDAGESGPDYAALVAKEGTVLLEEARSCGIWGQAATWNTANWGGDFDVSLFNEQTCVVVMYSSDIAPQLVLQGMDDSWNQVNPVYVGGGYALFTYEDITKVYDDFTQLGAVHIAAAGSELTVTEVKFVTIGDDGGSEDPEQPEYIAKLTKETVGETDTYSFRFKDYLASYEKDDTIKITVELEGNVYFNGAIGGSDVEATGNFASARFESGEDNTAVATLTVTAPYDYDWNNGNVVLWWVNEQEGVAYPEVTIKSITLEVVEDEAEPEQPEYIAKLTKETVDETDSYSFRFKDYLASYEKGDTIKITVELEGDVYFNGAIGGTDVEATNNFASAGFESGEDYTAVATLTVTAPYDYDGNNGNVVLWWVNEQEGVTYPEVTIKSITLEVVEDEADPEPTGSIAVVSTETEDSNKVTLYAEDYVEGLAVGDTVKVTATLQGTAGYQGAVGAMEIAEGNTEASWGQTNFSGDETGSITVERTFVLPYPSNGVQIQIWDTDATVTVLSFTVEKVSSETGDDGQDESNGIEPYSVDGQKQEDPAKQEEPIKQEEPTGDEGEESDDSTGEGLDDGSQETPGDGSGEDDGDDLEVEV